MYQIVKVQLQLLLPDAKLYTIQLGSEWIFELAVLNKIHDIQYTVYTIHIIHCNLKVLFVALSKHLCSSVEIDKVQLYLSELLHCFCAALHCSLECTAALVQCTVFVQSGIELYSCNPVLHCICAIWYCTVFVQYGIALHLCI